MVRVHSRRHQRTRRHPAVLATSDIWLITTFYAFIGNLLQGVARQLYDRIGRNRGFIQ